MPNETKPPDNIDRLLKHLKDGSLAARLVQARRTSRDTDPFQSMKAVITAELEQARGKLANTKD